jgi:hypothetical protein
MNGPIDASPVTSGFHRLGKIQRSDLSLEKRDKTKPKERPTNFDLWKMQSNHNHIPTWENKSCEENHRHILQEAEQSQPFSMVGK